MSEIDWSELGVSELPTGTVTLLLADVEGSTRLWETQPHEMTAAVARLDQQVSEAITVHGGIRPVEQGEGDSFVIAFARASDAVACAVQLQSAPLAPIRLRIGLHTGEVQLRDEGNYIGPTINRTARLRDLAHGGQTVLSGATEPLVIDQLPPGVSLKELGTQSLRDLPRPERVVQLCHPDLCNDFPPLRTADSVAAHNLPAEFTTFIGRREETTSLHEALRSNRLVTLTGAGGAGKTRLAVHIAGELAAEFADGICYVDLAPITHPDVVPVTAARALGLPDQPGRTTMDTLLRFIRGRRLLLVLDNCEHLIDASAALVVGLLGGAPGLNVLATSREPLGVSGEATWQVPSLSLTDDAIALFADRARLARTDFTITDDDAATVEEICRRLDGMPLAIELAAARVRAMTLAEILDSLHDRFRLLTGGSRTAVRRQQTLRASVDWSHALLTHTERILFRRLAVFLGGFDLDAASAIAGADDIEPYQVLDQLTLLVDKSLVVAETSGGRTRYRLLETIRQYALEKLGESGEADGVRSRHRDHYIAMAALLDAPARSDYQRRVVQAEIEMDNLRGALGWSLETADREQALALASSLHPVWFARGRFQEGRAWFATVLDGDSELADVAPAVYARALADRSVLDNWANTANSLEEAQRALAIARELGDPALMARTLTACGYVAGQSYDTEVAYSCFAEAIGLARAVDDRWRLSQILAWQSNSAVMAGDPVTAGSTAEEGSRLAEMIGDRANLLQCRSSLSWSHLMRGEVSEAVAGFRAALVESTAADDAMMKASDLMGLGIALAYLGDVDGSRDAGNMGVEVGAELGEYFVAMGYGTLSHAAVADADAVAAREASELAYRYFSPQPEMAAIQRAFGAHAELSGGDLQAARRWADEAVAVTKNWHQAAALLIRARVAIAQGELDAAERDAHHALTVAVASRVLLPLPEVLEVLADLATPVDGRRAARLYGAAEALRQRTCTKRFTIHDARYAASVVALRETLDELDFDAAWAEGSALSGDEAVAYAQRGRGERKRPSNGWASLTPAELDVVKLASEGLANKEIATRLFISPRTVQAHLTHIFAKLGVTSRVQLVQEAAGRFQSTD